MPDLKVLLVDDAALMRKIEVKALNSLGFNDIIEANDGQEAIEFLEINDGVQLVISDWDMPRKTGYELLCWTRNDARYKELPFLMATARGEKKEINKANEAGVSGFISKPFNEIELLNKINQALGLGDQEVVQEKIIVDDNGKVIFNICHIQITDHLALGVLKYLIEIGEFTPKTFKLNTECMPSWNPVALAIEENTFDAAFILAPIAMELFSSGTPIKLISLAHKNGSICIRNKNRMDYQKPYSDFFKDSSFYIPHRLSIHHMMAHMFFSEMGLNAGTAGSNDLDVTFEVIPPIQMPESLAENKSSSGFMVAEPIGTKAIKAGIGELQFLSGQLWENHPCCVFVVRDEFIKAHPDAVYEFTSLLVKAGNRIMQDPDLASDVALKFLDPDKKLGLKKEIILSVLTEPKGIKTNDLVPVISDFEKIQDYMYNKMHLGNIIKINDFVDLKFINKIDSERNIPAQIAKNSLQDDDLIYDDFEEDNIKDKYMTFILGSEQLGVPISYIMEIIRMQKITELPNVENYIEGVMNLRGRVIPVINMRKRFNMGPKEYDDKTCIIVIDYHKLNIGIIVDEILEVIDIPSNDVDIAPQTNKGSCSNFIAGMGKINNTVKIILDIDRLLDKNTNII